MSKQKYWLGFSLIPEIGPRRIAQLIQALGDLEAAWRATGFQLEQAGLERLAVANVLQFRPGLDLDAELAKVRQAGARLVALTDDEYPTNLKELPEAPPVLYVRGTLTPGDQFALGIVGTRNATKHGRDAAYDFARMLARQGITTVSGLAHGIDVSAHRGALDGGHRTIAVLGTGIDLIYPRDHHDLAMKMVENGALVSELPIGTPPEGRNFPRRNRIISGLALGVLVVEAPLGSGALITAEAALEQGRDVFAMPGNIYNPMSRGTNRLIQEGAKLVMEIDDILTELNLAHTHIEVRTRTRSIVPANETEAQLLRYLSADPIHIDELVRLTSLPVATVTGALTILELKGLAQMAGHMHYSLTP